MVEGWIEGPCAEAADLRGINRLMTDFYDDPAFVRDLFDFVLEMGLRFADAQVQAGAELIGLGDAAASLVGPAIYEEFVWPYEQKMVDGIHGMGAKVRLHICGNIRRILTPVGKLGCELVDVDYPAPLEEARRDNGARSGFGRQLEPRGGRAQRHAGDDLARLGRMSSAGRAAVGGGRRLRDPA